MDQLVFKTLFYVRVMTLIQLVSFTVSFVSCVSVTPPGDVVGGQPLTLQCTITREVRERWAVTWSYHNGTTVTRVYFSTCTPSIEVTVTSPPGLSGGCRANSGEEVYTLTIQNVTADMDGSTWECGYRLETKRVTLNVKVPVTRVILTHPPNAVLAGDHTNFTCVTSPSKPKACINWYIQRPGNITKINQGEPDCDQTSTSVSSTTRTLRFTARAEEDGADLYCTANNSVTDPPVRSQSYTLNVHYPPRSPLSLTGYATNTPITTGESVTLTCKVGKGNPRPILTWSQDCRSPTNILTGNDGNPQINVSVTGDRLLNQKSCFCRGNQDGSLTGWRDEKRVAFNVTFGPNHIILRTNIRQSGNTASATENSTVTFTCASGESNPAAVLSWYNNTSIVLAAELSPVRTESGPNYGYLSTQQYTVIVDRYQDGDVIKCEGRWLGNTKLNKTLTLNVTYRPLVTCKERYTFNENDYVELKCKSQANPDSTFIWTHSSGGQWTNQTESFLGHIQRTVLRIKKISRDDAGVYTVTARNSVGSDSFSTNITVYYSPDVTVVSQHGTEIIDGSSVQLECQAEGLPANYTYSVWSHLIGDRQLPLIHHNTWRYLTIRNVTFQDQGIYRCGASNGIGGYQQNQSEIRVKARPQLSEQTGIYATAMDETVQLSVGFVSYPSYTHISWYKIQKGAVNILDISGENGSRYRQTVTNDELDFVFYGSLVKLPGQTASLEIANVKWTDFTDYMLTVENKLGYSDYTVSLYLLDRPYAPKCQLATCIEGKGNITWISSFNGGSTQTFSLEYRKEGDNWSFLKENIPDPGENKTLSETVTGLVSGETYRFRVQSHNRWNSSDSVVISCVVERIQGQDLYTGNNDLKVGLAVGFTLPVLLIAGVVLLFIVRRQRSLKPGVGRSYLSQQSTTNNVNSDTATQGHLYQSLTMARLAPSPPIYQNTSPEYENISYDNTLSQGSDYEKLQMMQKVPSVDLHLYENAQISSITPAIHSQIAS